MFIARLVFVLVFEHSVFFITQLLAHLIPATPASLARQMKREAGEMRTILADQENNLEPENQDIFPDDIFSGDL